ncbi:uncharacterized protein LOC142162203 [Nicotiana tabacum]|uniref:Uncharacterized protein LOC142162203 n=1 Tax=Nicotiana tabacum TaxID=4097 RepID=A0AC58RPG9_TOBAC
MTNDNPTGTPSSSSTTPRTVFHEDDFTHPCHPLYVHPSDVLWQRCNDLVVSWLINSMSKEISHSVEYSEYAKDILRELEERYGKVDGARVFELKKELAYIYQGSLDIASYFNKIKQLWDEIAFYKVRVCTCGSKVVEDEEQKVYQFLMGLNDTYMQTHNNILMMKPLLSVGNMYIILLSDKK